MNDLTKPLTYGPILAALVAIACSACTTDFEPAKLFNALSPQTTPSPVEVPPPTPQRPLDASADAQDAIRAVQVTPESTDKQVQRDTSAVVQIPGDPTAAARLATAIEADDPCIGDLAKTDRCKSGLTPTADHGPRADGDKLTILAPSSNAITDFDPVRAVNEIGRGKTLSQAAQSAGSDFLSGDPTRRPDQPPEEEVLPEGTSIEGLPSSVLLQQGTPQ